MSRPKKDRIVGSPPVVRVFKPQGIPIRALGVLRMTLDECEAMRLVDLCGLSHEEAAERMGVSRPTLTRLLASAHEKVAKALVEGWALVVEKGPVSLQAERFFCEDCESTWTAKESEVCPECGSTHLSVWGGGFGRRNRRRGRY